MLYTRDKTGLYTNIYISLIVKLDHLAGKMHTEQRYDVTLYIIKNTKDYISVDYGSWLEGCLTPDLSFCRLAGLLSILSLSVGEKAVICSGSNFDTKCATFLF